MGNAKIYEKIGKKVKVLRERFEYSQEEVAHALGYKSRVTVSKIENGDYTVNADILEKLSKLFHVPVNELVDDETDGNNEQSLWSALQKDTSLSPSDIEKVLDYIEYIKNK